MEELLTDNPEPGTPPVCSPTPESPLTSGEARINPVAANESAEDMEAVVDQLHAIVEGLLPWLKDDITSSGSSTPSPDIELEDLLEFEAAAQRDSTPELLNEVFEFRDPEPEQLNEAEDAAQIRPDLEHLNEIFKFRDPEPGQLNEMSEFGEAAQMDPE